MVGLFSGLELGSSRLVDAIGYQKAHLWQAPKLHQNVQIRSVWDMVKPAVLLLCASCQLRFHFKPSYVRNTIWKGSKRRPFALSSSWISCEMISPSIMVVAKLLAKTEAALLDLLGMFWTNTRQDFGWQVLTQCQVNNLLRNQVISPIFSLFLDVTTFRITCSCPPFFLPAKALWWSVDPTCYRISAWRQ